MLRITATAMTYHDDLPIPDLLALQQFRSEDHEHDEMLFIAVHPIPD